MRRNRANRVAWAGLVIAAAFCVAQPSRAADPADAPVEPAPAPSEPDFGGPLELRDVFLPAQLRPQSYPETAVVLAPDDFSLRVVADWANHLARTDTFLFDGESVTTTLQVRYAPWQRIELGLDVPYTSRFDGTLDPLIESVETSLDARVQARFDLPRFDWSALVLRRDGSRRLRMRNSDRFGDISVRGKFALARKSELGFDAALVASLGLPTGGGTFGGEGVTPGIGLHAQLPFETVNLFAGATLQHHTDATEQSFLLAPWRWMSYVGAEWRPFHGWLGLLAEYQIYGPLARSNTPLTKPSHYYAGGLRLYLPWRTTLDATVIENLGLIENRNSSDITFQVGLGWRFGP